jgi:hypothetical protein
MDQSGGPQICVGGWRVDVTDARPFDVLAPDTPLDLTLDCVSSQLDSRRLTQAVIF